MKEKTVLCRPPNQPQIKGKRPKAYAKHIFEGKADLEGFVACSRCGQRHQVGGF